LPLSKAYAKTAYNKNRIKRLIGEYMLLGKTKKMRLSALFLAAAIGAANIMPSNALAKSTAPEHGQSTPKSMLVINAKSGEVYYSHNPQKQWITASLNKAMTLHLLFEHMIANNQTPQDTLTISKNAVGYLKGWNASSLRARAGKVLTYDQAARAIIVKSAADVSYAIAEHVSGTHKDFVTLMNKRAKQWDMLDTIFTDASGFSKPHITRKRRATHHSKSTACDMTVMMQHITAAHPDLYETYFGAIKYKRSNGKTSSPSSLFTRQYEHAEGQKSGYTRASRNNLIASARDGDTQLIGAALGTYWRPDSNRIMAEQFTAAFAKEQNDTANMQPVPFTDFSYMNEETSAVKIDNDMPTIRKICSRLEPQS
jgi:D-alanyl-D-alanine carboxypeptidase